jgi:DNA-binding NarL/FixJ family response regulator
MPTQKKEAAIPRQESVRVAAIGDTCVSARGLAAIVGDDRKYSVCGYANSFEDANKLIRNCRPDVLLIEPFMQNIDGIRWIKELVAEFENLRILVVSRQSEQTYAERSLRAGAAGYWMKNSSSAELMRALATVVAGEIYVSPRIASLAITKLAGRHGKIPDKLQVLSDRELAVFSLIAGGQGTGQIAQELGVSRKTIETHCEHIKDKLGYANANELRHGAQEWLGNS